MTLTPLDRRYDASVRRVWTNVLGSIGRQWTDLRSWRGSDVAGFQRAALPVLRGGQRQVASLTTYYLEQLYRDITGDISRADVDFDRVSGAAIRNGTDPADVYERPFKEVWLALSNDEPLSVAVDRGANRLQSLVKTDLQLTRTHTAREVTEEQPGVTYTIREPIGEYNCALCLVASTQRYHKRELLPIHPGCDCLVKTVKADYDPGQVIDEEKLQRIHDAVENAIGQSDRSARAVDYRKIIVTNEHGEIGPVLGFKNQNFTGPDDLGADRHSPRADGDTETPDRLGDSIVDVDESTDIGRALSHVRDVITAVHTVDRAMPEIPLTVENREGYLGVYVRTRGGESRRLALNPDGPWPHLTAAHELGHFLDHKGLGSDLSDEATTTEIDEGGILHEWWDAVQGTAAYQMLAFMRSQPHESEWARVERHGVVEPFVLDHRHIDYLMSPREMFGRAYAQWIATDSGDETLGEELERASDPGRGAVLIAGFTAGYPRQWEAEDFEPIADALRATFRRLGLIADEEEL